ncbi:uncharacterized protein PHACADRAFT_258260 [Phanerochaete carnosa HHB-10118-sp]|uniref:Uncharacterized protein n=1 Tax=Phanerochaete carnosa (strain HHB-10118-sp) TaxID=650164 RepID=K5WVG4_PHACS|nr:uncharacterized protein PHACADRAFT_258260 [Phanerochaete carnosa HHB-10118-sp]EKM54422.1 hypothetical protein PHACADRAFT_258260 [Phanerochaete carnosa HHB-10118-sp]
MAAPVSSYRLETPRARHPPPVPIRTRNTSPAPHLNESKDRKSLLCDLPSANPTSPRYSLPTSPTTRSQSRASRSRGMTPPPGRAPTPSRPLERDLEKFADVCRAWYFNQDQDAGHVMAQTMATLPSSHRAPFSRLQAQIRSAYHASVNARRNAEFQAHLAATQPGGSLMPHSRSDPRGSLARKERYERFERFVRTWCTMGMPGTKPFFEGLWGLMRLSVLPEHLGGSGGKRIEWQIDDAVFNESAGKEFMLEAIDVFKGVLGFEESSSLKRSPSIGGQPPYSPFSPLSPIHSRSQSSPLPADASIRTRSGKAPPIASTTQTKRPRAPSDPFLDTHTPPPLSTSYSSANTMAQLSTSGSSTADDASLPPTPQTETSDPFRQPLNSQNSLDSIDADGYMRTWIAPDLPNVEYLALLKLFPSFAVRNTLPRFPVTKGGARDIEEGGDGARSEIRIGTGKMWIGGQTRRPGWQGSWWTRFRLWLRTLFR